MPYLTIARFVGDPARLLDDYRRTSPVMDEVGRDHGILLHAGAPTDDGMLIVNLWPSREHSESAAADSRRIATVQSVGAALDQLRKEHYGLERCFLPGVPQTA